MIVIGLCGGSGSGKNEVQAAFLRRAVPGLDADAVYHSLTEHRSALTEALAERFGKAVLRADGSLDRKALAALVFCGGEAQSGRLADLNALTHSAVLEVCRSQLARWREAGERMALINAPLLLESGFDGECDYTVAVLAPVSLRVARIMARDGLSEEQARARIAAQPSDEFLREHTDFQIENATTEAALDQRVEELYRTWLRETEE